MTSAFLPCPVAEYRDRLGRVQEAMARDALSTLVVADPANLYSLTGHDAWSFSVRQCLIVPASGEPHRSCARWTCPVPGARHTCPRAPHTREKPPRTRREAST